MTMVLASRNRKKIEEMQTLLAKHLGADVKILSLDDIGFTGDIEENGTTFEENAYIKAKYIAEKTGKITVAGKIAIIFEKN